MKTNIAFLWLLLLGPQSVLGGALPKNVLKTAERLRDAALKDDTAYRFLESLTTEIGPRLAGTDDEMRARRWSVAKLEAIGFRPGQVRVEPFEMETWVRGDERAAVLSPYPQKLVVTALGRSGSTGDKDVVGEVVFFNTLAELEARAEGSLSGKIVYLSHAMGKTQDGSSYGYFGRVRFSGPSIAQKRGAKACLIRSVGTQRHRMPHTGGTNWEDGQDRIPALALSAPDADQLERMFQKKKTVRVSMRVTPKVLGTTKSANILVDLKGSTRKNEFVLLGGHLDSWDLGTGAVDDGAGVAITTAALRLIQKMGLRPKRSIRLIHWGAEEVGLLGAKAYAKKHAAELPHHVLGSESDFGAERIYAIHAQVSDEGQAVVDAMIDVLAPLGVGAGVKGATFQGSSGPDLSPLHAMGLPRFRLAQDGTDYFDLHHTPDDTFDKIDPAALRQNVAAYAVFLWLAANAEVDFRAPTSSVNASK